MRPANLSKWTRRKLARSDRGATILEFALTALPLMFLIFGTIELGLIFAANIDLSNAVLSVTRQVRLGSIILPGMAATSSSGSQMSLADFKAAICSRFSLLTNALCLSQLQVDVRVLSNFAAAPPNPISGSNFSTAGFCFYSGTPGAIVSLRTYLLWPVTTPVLLAPLSSVTSVTASSGSSSGNFFVLKSHEAFVNEPNSAISNTGNGC